MAVAFVRNQSGAFNKTSGTTLDTFISGTPSDAGNLLVACFVFDNAAVTLKPAITSITKPAGETANWVFIEAIRSTSTSSGAFADGEMWAIKTTISWTNATTITATFDNTITMKASGIREFSGAEATVRSTTGISYSTTTTAASAITLGTAPVIGDLAVGLIFTSNTGTGPLGDNDTTGGSWDAGQVVNSSGSSAATNNAGVMQYKVVTSTSHQTLNNQATLTAGNGVIVAIFQATIQPLVTQAAYRFYADGTETGSTALGTQSTAYTADLSGGDLNLGLRMRLQETVGGVVPATDDWQLQWEKNASGTWANVSSPTLIIDRYDFSNLSSRDNIFGSSNIVAQSFLGDGRPLGQVDFSLRQSGSPTGTVAAVLYAHDGGTFGTTGLPTGAVLATSTTTVTASTLPTTDTTFTFNFDGTFTPAAGTPYFIGLLATGGANAPNYVQVALDNTSPTHAGNGAHFAAGWSALGGDLCFEVRTSGVVGTTAIRYDSPNLTDGAATTNRLTGGTGSFVAGEVSEDGLADNLGWTVSNYTELLYSLTLKQADLANGDTLRFRVLRNGATTSLTYTATPTVNVTLTTVPQPPRNIRLSNPALTRSFNW